MEGLGITLNVLKYVARGGELLIACEVAVSTLDDAKAFRQIQRERGLVADQNLGRQPSAAGVDGVPQKAATDTTSRKQRIDIQPRNLAISISDKTMRSAVGLGDHQLAREQSLAIGGLLKRKKRSLEMRGAQFMHSRCVVNLAEPQPIFRLVGTQVHDS
jgi:hypothetical protein